MFFRIKKSGTRGYVQVVENRRVNGTAQQSVIATLGRSWEYRRRRNAPQRHGDDTHATNGETLLHAQHAAHDQREVSPRTGSTSHSSCYRPL